MLLDEDEEVLEDNYVFSKLNQQSKKGFSKDTGVNSFMTEMEPRTICQKQWAFARRYCREFEAETRDVNPLQGKAKR